MRATTTNNTKYYGLTFEERKRVANLYNKSDYDSFMLVKNIVKKSDIVSEQEKNAIKGKITMLVCMNGILEGWITRNDVAYFGIPSDMFDSLENTYKNGDDLVGKYYYAKWELLHLFGVENVGGDAYVREENEMLESRLSKCSEMELEELAFVCGISVEELRSEIMGVENGGLQNVGFTMNVCLSESQESYEKYFFYLEVSKPTYGENVITPVIRRETSIGGKNLSVCKKDVGMNEDGKLVSFNKDCFLNALRGDYERFLYTCEKQASMDGFKYKIDRFESGLADIELSHTQEVEKAME